MIYEYALEPELVASWSDRKSCRYFREQFGIGTARAVSKFPSRWKRMVWEALNRQENVTENSRARLTELIQRLTETSIGRTDHIWDEARPWLENAIAEHDRLAFHAILACGSANCDCVLTEAEVDAHQTLWGVERGVTVERTAEALSEAVGSMLRCARRLVLVDHTLGLENKRYRRTIEAFLCKALTARPNKVIDEIQIVSASHAAPGFFEEKCRDFLATILPRGRAVSVTKIRGSVGSDRPHNRFILTELGGVSFQFGLDEGRAGELEDISILPTEIYRTRWRQYTNLEESFEIEVGPIEIEGEAENGL